MDIEVRMDALAVLAQARSEVWQGQLPAPVPAVRS